MKVILLSAASCIHTTRWANGLAEQGVEVHLVSLHSLKHHLDERVHLHNLPFGAPWGYFLAVNALKKLVSAIKPDIVNTHYASGYGTLARMAAIAPNLLSVWGSDVYDFPAKSKIHRFLLRQNLKAATAIASTSLCMARETEKTYSHESVFITPFGIDENVFMPKPKPAELADKIVVGTLKTLKAKYGIDTLIEAFASAWNTAGKPDNLVLEITGEGPDRTELEALALKLGIQKQITFHGAVKHENVPDMLSRLDIYVALSNEESFGVAILEASSSGLPVVVSDADGPAEVVINNETGLIVPKQSSKDAAAAILTLLNAPRMRHQMGQKGRQHVLDKYTWYKSVEIMIGAYKQVVKMNTESMS